MNDKSQMNDKKLPWISTRGTELVTEDGKPILLRGFGLGGWLLPEGYMWQFHEKCDRPRRMEQLVNDTAGPDYARNFWKRYYDAYITESDIQLIAEEGFNSIRLPFNSRTLAAKDADGTLRFLREMLGRIDDCISWCRKHGLYIILDMHGAPGGQTGTNIDDSENDLPELFTKPENEKLCIELWRMIARRYAGESTIAGYDLLNEPLPDWFHQYHHLVTPLYKKIRNAVRSVDTRHMIILEGVHWATDWSIFDEFADEPFDDRYMLQFHKYWNNPDRPSIQQFLDFRERLQVPIFMGEGGENHIDWYTGAFPLFEDLNISWNFWTYKKMDCTNSPITFPRPEDWDSVLSLTQTKAQADESTGSSESGSASAACQPAGYQVDNSGRTREKARALFDRFLEALSSGSRINAPVFRALKREIPVSIPAEYYNDYHIITPRVPGAELRMDEPVSILFRDSPDSGRTGPVSYLRQAGEEQPKDQLLCVLLHAGETLWYRVSSRKQTTCRLRFDLRRSIDAEVAGLEVLGAENSGTAEPEKEKSGTAGSCIEVVTDDSPWSVVYGSGGVVLTLEAGTHKLGIKAVSIPVILGRLELELVPELEQVPGLDPEKKPGEQ